MADKQAGQQHCTLLRNFQRPTGRNNTITVQDIFIFVILLFDTAYISPWHLVSLADSILCCCAWMIQHRQGSQDPTTPSSFSLEGKAEDEARKERKRERQDGAQVGAFSHLESLRKM